VIVATGGILDIATFSDTVGLVQLTGGAITGTSGVLTGSSYDLQAGTVTAILGGAGIAAVKSTVGTVTLSGANSFSGGLDLNGGILRVGHNSALGTGTLTLTAGQLSSSSTTGYTLANALVLAGPVTLGDAVNTGELTFTTDIDLGAVDRTFTTASGITFAGVVSNGGLIKEGSATLTLSGANTFAGATAVNAGTLATVGNARLTASSGVTTLAGTTLRLGGAETINTLANAGTVNLVNVGSALTTGATDYTLGGTVSGLGSLIKSGTGLLTLDAAGTFSYTGGTTVNAGKLLLGANSRLADTGTVTVNGGSFDLGGFADTVGTVTLTGGTVENGTLTVNAANTFALQAGTVSAVLAGTAALNKTTGGSVTLSGANSYSGATTVSAGTLVTDAGALGGTSGITVNGATLTAVDANSTATLSQRHGLRHVLRRRPLPRERRERQHHRRRAAVHGLDGYGHDRLPWRRRPYLLRQRCGHHQRHLRRHGRGHGPADFRYLGRHGLRRNAQLRFYHRRCHDDRQRRDRHDA
jgi:autotransporter-associated beta strand protein